MNLWKLILITLSALLLLQSDKPSEPSGYYYVINDDLIPNHVFFYNNSLHSDLYITKELSDSLTNLFHNKKYVFAFCDGNTCIDTLRYINFDKLLFYIVYTPSLCKFYMYPESLLGTYEFIPTRTEQDLISFAVSQLDFGDTLPEFILRKEMPHNCIIESSYFSLHIISDKKNTNIVSDLYAMEVTEEVHFLISALKALVIDHWNKEHKIDEVPDEKVLRLDDEIISKKYGPPPPPEDLLDGSYFDDGME